MEPAVVGLGGAVEAVCPIGLHDDGHRPAVPPQGGEVTGHRSRHAAHPGLEEQVGGGLVQGLGDLPGQGGVPLHDVGGDGLVPLPGGVLN